MSNNLESCYEEIKFKGHDGSFGKGYKVDGTSEGASLRVIARLGTLHCCDYILIHNGGYTLIEDTNLGETIRDIEEEYDAMMTSGDQRKKFVRKRIRLENSLKVYGTLLILCRLDMNPQHCVFWLVVTGDDVNAKLVRNLDPYDELKHDIASALMGDEDDHGNRNPPLHGALRGAKLVEEVKVLTVEEFRKLRK